MRFLNYIYLFTFIISLSCNEKKKEQNNNDVKFKTQNTSNIIVAKTPPMGWNSFDAYDCRINEQEFKATVDFMAENLLEYGWEYAVIDYIWWHPEPGN